MKFRPCIDIHNGKVKQIVGGSLKDEENQAYENFVSEKDASFYAKLYQTYDLKGGHVILLNGTGSLYYEATKKEAEKALFTYRNGLQVGGGITDLNAVEFLEAGASHVIVTSFVFRDGRIQYDNLERLVRAVGKDKIVLDLSCRKKNKDYYIVTDRWQKYTDVILNEKTLHYLASFCDEFLVHAVDVEGKAGGIDKEVVQRLGSFEKKKITYAGGVHNFEDLEQLKQFGNNQIDVTIGSALSLFGGRMDFEEVVNYTKKEPI